MRRVRWGFWTGAGVRVAQRLGLWLVPRLGLWLMHRVGRRARWAWRAPQQMPRHARPQLDDGGAVSMRDAIVRRASSVYTVELLSALTAAARADDLALASTSPIAPDLVGSDVLPGAPA